MPRRVKSSIATWTAAPADAPDAGGRVAENAMPNAPDLRQLLDVDVEQLAGAALPAPQAGALRLEPTEPIQPQATLDGHDRRDREPVVICDPERTAVLVARPENLPGRSLSDLPRNALRAGGPIPQPATRSARNRATHLWTVRSEIPQRSGWCGRAPAGA